MILRMWNSSETYSWFVSVGLCVVELLRPSAEERGCCTKLIYIAFTEGTAQTNKVSSSAI